MRFLLLLLLLPMAAFAQTADSPAVLIADDVSLSPEKVLVATGNVQVYQGDVGLTASRITYDQRSGNLVIDGPIRMQDGEDVVVLASAAELDQGLRNGILRSARMVIAQQVQLAAVQINRVDARYSQLYKTAVTSCKVCEDGRPPLWQIRAQRVIHDQQERQLYFDNAQIRVGNVPILYLPRLRLPDPTLKRATGFLMPTVSNTSQLGTGIKVPYFIRIGDHRDLTLTPYLSRKTRTLQWRYRQAFRTGRIEINGAVTDDDLDTGGKRAYVIGTGSFELRNDFRLTFDIEATSDDAYLKQYGYSGKDRLDSAITLSRTRRDEYLQAGLIHYHSLRAGEDDSTLPTLVLDGLYERRLFPSALGGEIRFALAGHTHRRTSDIDVKGRDLARLHAEAHWLRSWFLRGGLVIDTNFGFAADMFNISQDSNFPGSSNQVNPQASVALRYPMQRTGADGSRQFLEPIIQVSWTGGNQADVPNVESTRTEFDEGNLLALSRFAQADRREHGTTLALGLNWARYDPDGWEAYVSAGQILREDANPNFTKTSGLQGTYSDYLVAGQIKTQAGLALGGRALFDDSFDFSKVELRGDWSTQRVRLGGSFLWLVDDPAENRAKDVSEFTLDGGYGLDRHWTLNGKWRYDAADDRTAGAGLGMSYVNECVSVDLSVERLFASATTVEPDTKFGLSIGLRGFAASNGTERYTRSCK